ncbi:MAG: DEAD/DEAH box helicase family protein [Proteobacteria bacterium]|nr:DEAD/DEAH box helicase family protein [Pseudomonadota bacterium]
MTEQFTGNWLISFDSGSLILRVPPEDTEKALELLPQFVWDPRIKALRGSAMLYRRLLIQLTKRGVTYEDRARTYEDLSLSFQFSRVPFFYQSEALDAWENNGSSGIVVLPTGAGKSYVAQLAMARKNRSTLVITPTLDLVAQWHMNLESAFGIKCGIIGGGTYDLKPITVTTYDSAYIHMEHIGHAFGLLVFDEVHHLPTQTYALSAIHAIAPYRLGLTATPEREAPHSYAQLVGPIVYTQTIRALAGQNLADYETAQYEVELDADEREAYEEYRACYLNFVRDNHIRMGSPDGWTEFLRLSSRSEQGRNALHAHRAQRAITQHCRAKMTLLNTLLARHRSDRTIIFTADNETVYRISREYLVPAITHQSPVKERRAILEGFNTGRYPVVVTSKVLNEGVDIPAANVGIVLSGSGSVREHVQRLGRILRAAKDKSAILYELVAKNTSEAFTSEKRRQHDAF